MLISLRVPLRTRPPPWNNIKLFVSPSRPALFLSSWRRSGLLLLNHSADARYIIQPLKPRYADFWGISRIPFRVPRPLLSFSSPETPSRTPCICTTASYSRCRCESRNFPRNFLNNSYSHICILAALWKFARAKWIIRLCDSRFSNGISTCVLFQIACTWSQCIWLISIFAVFYRKPIKFQVAMEKWKK